MPKQLGQVVARTMHGKSWLQADVVVHTWVGLLWKSTPHVLVTVSKCVINKLEKYLDVNMGKAGSVV